MTPDRLVAAVRERLDDREAAANDIGRIGLDTLLPGAIIDRTGATVFFTTDVYKRIVATFDPAAVLRRVAAQRRVLERHRPYVGDSGQATCEHCPADYEDEPTPWPCPEFRDLADGLGIDLEEP